MLEGQKAEELVVNERPANGESSVVVADLLLGIREGTLGSEELVPVEVVHGAVEGIGARTQRKVDRAAGIATSLRARLCLRGELVHGVERENNSGDARDAALVHSGDFMPEVVVVYTVDLPVHLIGARSIERTIAASAVSGVTGGEADHLGEVPTVHGKIGDSLGVEHRSLGYGGRVECDARGLYLDGSAGRGDWKLGGKREDHTCRHGDFFRLDDAESICGDGDGIRSKW